MPGVSLFSWLMVDVLPSNSDPELMADIRQALVSVDSSLLPWLESTQKQTLGREEVL